MADEEMRDDVVADDVTQVETVAEAAEETTDVAAEVVEETVDVAAEVTAEADHVAEEAAADELDAVDEVIADSANDALDEAEREPVQVAAAPAKPQLGQVALIGIACAALVLGIIIGKFLLGGAGAGTTAGLLEGRTSITEAELDQPVAIMTYKGQSRTITAREVIVQNGSLESVMDEEGNYYMPSADLVLSVARNRILELEAENRGMSVTDEEVAAFAEENLGSSDYASIGATYGMDEQAVIDVLRSSATMAKLRKDVVGETTATMPDMPVAPADDADVTKPTADYAAYIIELAGDEWDAEADTWASVDGQYAMALANYEISKDGATYEAAQSAYYVAYQLYSQEASIASAQWTEYVNGLLANGKIELSSLVA